MNSDFDHRISKIPILRQLARKARRVKLPWLSGMSLYELVSIYMVGIAESAITYRAAAISFSFFMALFPFCLFILNLIPYIPIDNFQADFMQFVAQNVPPNTYDAIARILNDILNNSHSGLLSTGVILSIFLAANGLNSILGGFETAKHVIIRRGFFKQYAVALGMSIFMVFILLFTIATVVTIEVFLHQTRIENFFSEKIPLIQATRYIFLIAMVLAYYFCSI